MKLFVNNIERDAKSRAHTATHLLHSELEKIIPDTQQSWSLVDSDYLRFDFKSEKLLTPKQIRQIEKNINNIIKQWFEVNIFETNIDDAKKLWAKAFFEDKYWDIVRVVKIFNKIDTISIELCWWTHVKNTNKIWSFKIISQEAVASWIKRIIAITWPKIIEYFHKLEDSFFDIANILWVSEKQIIEKINKNKKEFEDIYSKYTSIKNLYLTNILQNLIWKNNIWQFDNVIFVDSFNWLKNFKLNEISQHIQKLDNYWNILIYNDEWWYIILSKNNEAKKLWKSFELKWWWNDKIFQWKDKKILDIVKR